MKSSLRGALMVLLLSGLMVQFSGGLVLAKDGEVVAKVGTVPVTVYELQRAQQKLVPINSSFHSGISRERLAQLQEEALASLIERAYKVNFALAEKLVIDNKIVDEKLEGVRKKFKTKKEFKQALGDEEEKGLRASIQRELQAEAAEKQAVTDRVRISDADVRTYFDQNKATYLRPKQFKASHILIKVDPSSNKQEREALDKKVNDLAARAKAGEDFYNLAYYNSDDRSKYVGGDIGYFHEGQTVKEFEETILKMKPGEISDPVKTLYGFHIIKLVEVNPQRQLEFDEVSGKIRQSLETKQRDKLYAEWMERLKAQYPLERY